jgi:nucleoside-diphosphate-sugar epimerase
LPKYLITGGAGFIGSHLAEALVSQEQSVRILDNFRTGKRENLAAVSGKVEIVEGDIRDRKTVQAAVRGVDCILHQAALVSVAESIAHPEETLEVNGNGALNVLQAAEEAGVRRVVLASSCAVYGEGPVPAREDQAPMPLSPYAASKLAMEALAASYYFSFGLLTTCLRYFNVYGPRQSPDSPYSGVIAIFVSRAISGSPIKIYGDGRQTRDFIYVGDVVRANLLAAQSERCAGRAVNIGTGRGLSLLDLHAELAALGGRRLALEYSAARPGDIYHSRCDPRRARALLGFRALTDFHAGLEATLRWRRGEAGSDTRGV